jgi:hypothetical protein
VLKVLLLFVISLCSSNLSLAQEGSGGLYHFFGGQDIDYWGEGKLVKEGSTDRQPKTLQTEPALQGANVIRSADAQPFSWTRYEDPRNPEFWDDGGDWIPPRPFREAVANPTSENIAAYLDWVERKGMLVTKFQEKLSQQQPASSGASSKAAAATQWNEVQIAYFYQSSCPHCQSSKQTIESAQSLGAKVTYIQLDSGLNPPLHAGSIPYSKEWAANFEVSVTPTWFLKYGSKTAKLSGAQDIDQLKQFISTMGETR